LLPRFYTFKAKKHSIGNSIPFIPLSFKGEGEEKERGASAPLKHPIKFWEGDTGDRVTILKGTKTLIYFVVNPTLKEYPKNQPCVIISLTLS